MKRDFFKNLCRVNGRRLASSALVLALGAYLTSRGLNLLEVIVSLAVPAVIVFLDWYVTDCGKVRKNR